MQMSFVFSNFKFLYITTYYTTYTFTAYLNILHSFHRLFQYHFPQKKKKNYSGILNLPEKLRS